MDLYYEVNYGERGLPHRAAVRALTGGDSGDTGAGWTQAEALLIRVLDGAPPARLLAAGGGWIAGGRLIGWVVGLAGLGAQTAEAERVIRGCLERHAADLGLPLQIAERIIAEKIIINLDSIS